MRESESESDFESDSDFGPESAGDDDGDSNSLAPAAAAAVKKQSARPTKQKRTVKFVKGWLTNKVFKDWLVYDEMSNTMACRFCKKTDKYGVWATCGTNNFRYFS